MNLILIKEHFVSAIIRMEQRRAYLESLKSADDGNLESFTEYVARSLLNTQQIILLDLDQNQIDSF